MASIGNIYVVIKSEREGMPLRREKRLNTRIAVFRKPYHLQSLHVIYNICIYLLTLVVIFTVFYSVIL